MKFTITLIAKNESKTLPRLMESLSEFTSKGGQVVLVDTGSTDNTVELAKSLGCKVEAVGNRFRVVVSLPMAMRINTEYGDHANPIVLQGDKFFDYASARNFAASLAETDMVWHPDCDEVFTKLDLDAINKAIEEGAEQIYSTIVASHDAAGNPEIQFNHSRFYNRNKMHWTGMTHETIVPIEGEVKAITLPETVIKLEHFQNPLSVRGHYLVGLAFDRLTNPNDARKAHYFARELMYRGRFDLAVEAFKAHIAMNGWSVERAASMCMAGDCYMFLKNKDEAFKYYLMAFDADPTRREPLMKMAEYYYNNRRPEPLIALLNAVLSIKDNDSYMNHRPYYEHLPHEMMYWALWQKEEITASRMHFDVCLAFQPFNHKYLYDFRWYYPLPKMSFVIPSTKTAEELAAAIGSIKALNYPQDQIEILIEETFEKGVEKATGDWYIRAGEDLRFEEDALMAAFKTAYDNSKKFMAFSEGDFFMIRKDLEEKLCDVSPDQLYGQLDMLNQNMRCHRAKVSLSSNTPVEPAVK